MLGWGGIFLSYFKGKLFLADFFILLLPLSTYTHSRFIECSLMVWYKVENVQLSSGGTHTSGGNCWFKATITFASITVFITDVMFLYCHDPKV